MLRSARRCGLKTLFKLPEVIWKKIIKVVSSRPGHDLSLIMGWIINGERDVVNQALDFWHKENWGGNELHTLAWVATYGVDAVEDNN